jgi:hypothetical protein
MRPYRYSVILIFLGCARPPTNTSDDVSSSSTLITSSTLFAPTTTQITTETTESSLAMMTTNQNDSLSDGNSSTAALADVSVGDDVECFGNPPPQPCKAGYKCMAYNEGTFPNCFVTATFRCVPVSENAMTESEPCVAHLGDCGGEDTCDANTMCAYLQDGENGVCVPFCQASEVPDQFACKDDGVCTNLGSPYPLVCLDPCNPLIQDCPGGRICTANKYNFAARCVPPSGLSSAVGESCTESSDCQPGLACVPSAPPFCEKSCCVPYCDLNDSESCAQVPPLSCQEVGLTPPPEDIVNVGLCL